MKCKVYPLIVSLVVLVASSCNSKASYDYEYYGLNCPVKSIEVTTYKAESKFGEILNGDLEPDGNYLAVFNGVGNLESISYYDEDGDLSRIGKYKYNEENKVTAVSDYDNDGDLVAQTMYTYNNDHIESFTIKSYWSDKEVIRVYKHKWNGEYIIETDVLVDGELYSKTKYKNAYKNNREREWVKYDKDGKEVSRGYEEYNVCDRIIKHNEGDFYLEVQWNDNNLPIHLKNAHLWNNIDISWYSGDDECEYYVEYEYDKKGNWIKQIVYEGEIKKPLTISERIITY